MFCKWRKEETGTKQSPGQQRKKSLQSSLPSSWPHPVGSLPRPSRPTPRAWLGPRANWPPALTFPGESARGHVFLALGYFLSTKHNLIGAIWGLSWQWAIWIPQCPFPHPLLSPATGQVEHCSFWSASTPLAGGLIPVQRLFPEKFSLTLFQKEQGGVLLVDRMEEGGLLEVCQGY